MQTNFDGKLNYLMAELDELSSKIKALQSEIITVDGVLTQNSPNAAGSGAVFSALLNKADRSTTLAGYGITDAARANDLSSHTQNASNPHGVTKSQVGLGNVTNISQAAVDASNLSYENIDSWQSKLSRKIAEVILTTNVNSFTISGLNINADGGIYDIVLLTKATGHDVLRAKINDVNSNYNSSINRANGSATATVAIPNQCYYFDNYSFIGDTNSYVVGTISLFDNVFNFSGIASTADYGIQSHGTFCITNKNSISNITSITFYIEPSVGINFIAGTKLQIFKR